MVDPTFDDRVIEEGLLHLDAEGQETSEPTDRYVEAVAWQDMQELLACGGPKRCDACHTPWDRVEGIRIVFR
ncbi:MAG TPA: hypothetical protein VFE42_26860 [Chloroflexota bacterium]|nr:hypothetical protein [Chloroflexota bacterium]